MHHERSPSVYILASAPRGTLYIGVTSDLVKRVWEHRNDLADGFTRKYGVHRLVHFELHQRMYDAIQREKQLKKWNRMWKIELVESRNPEWKDLWEEVVGGGDPHHSHPRGSGDPC